MNISSLGASSIQDLLSLQRLYSSQHSKPTSKTNDDPFSESLKTSKNTSADSTKSIDSLSMLKSLKSGYSIDSSDLLLKALNKTDTTKSNDTNTLDALLGMIGTPVSADPFIKALNNNGSDSNDDVFSLFQGLQGSSSNTQTIETLFDSNTALLKSLQKSGMPSEKVSEILKQVQASSQYTNAGTATSPTLISGLFSTQA